MKYILFLLATCIVVLIYLGCLYKSSKYEKEEFDNKQIHLEGKVRIADGAENSKKIRVNKLCIDDECIDGNVLSSALSYFTDQGSGIRNTNWRKNAACIQDVCLFSENINAFNKNNIPQLSTSNTDPKQLFNANSSQIDKMIKNRKQFFTDKFPEKFSENYAVENETFNTEPFKSTWLMTHPMTGFFPLFYPRFPRASFKDKYLNEYYDFPYFHKSGKIEKTGQNVDSDENITKHFNNKGFKMALYNEDYSNVNTIENVHEALGYNVSKLNTNDLPTNVKGNLCYTPYSRVNLRTGQPDSSNQQLLFSKDKMEKDKDIIDKYNNDNPDFGNSEDINKMHLSGVPNFHACFDTYYETKDGSPKDYKETKHNYYVHDQEKQYNDISHLQAHGKQWDEKSMRGHVLAAIAYDGENFDGNEYPIYVPDTFGTDKTITMFSEKADWKPWAPFSWTETYEPSTTDLLEEIKKDIKEKDLDNLSDDAFGRRVASGQQEEGEWVWRIEPDNDGWSKKKWGNDKKNDPDFLTGFLYYRTWKIEMAAEFPPLPYREAGGFLSIKIFKGFKIRFYNNVWISRQADMDQLSFILPEGEYNNSHFNNNSFYKNYRFLREVMSAEKRKQRDIVTGLRASCGTASTTAAVLGVAAFFTAGFSAAYAAAAAASASVFCSALAAEEVKFAAMPTTYGINTPTIAVIKTNETTAPSTYVPSGIETMKRTERPEYEKNAREFRFGPPVPLTSSTINTSITQNQTTQAADVTTKSDEEIRDINQADRLKTFLDRES